MAKYRIAVLPGDGIGPEVVKEGLKILSVTSEVFGFTLETTEYPYGTDHFLKTGEKFPESALREMADHDAILLGAIGDPRVEVGMLERAIIAGIRFGLDLYVNLRPVQLFVTPSASPSHATPQVERVWPPTSISRPSIR